MKEKIIDMIISAIVKKGILYEARNINTDINIPEKGILINIKCDNMVLRIEKEGT